MNIMCRSGSQRMLVDESGKKFFIPTGDTDCVLEVPGIGVVNQDKLRGKKDGDVIEVAGKPYLLLTPLQLDNVARLERGAQVILPKDAAQIVIGLDVKAGDTVLEIGAGTGSLSIMLATALAPDGRLVSYERTERSAKLVARNLERAGLADVIEIRDEDAANCSETGIYDAAITDMPQPWDMLAIVTAALKPGGRFCAYVPNTHQVEMTVKAMRKLGFIDVRASETIQRNIVVGERGTRPDFRMLGHTGYLCFGRYPGPDWPPKDGRAPPKP